MMVRFFPLILLLLGVFAPISHAAFGSNHPAVQSQNNHRTPPPNPPNRANKPNNKPKNKPNLQRVTKNPRDTRHRRAQDDAHKPRRQKTLGEQWAEQCDDEFIDRIMMNEWISGQSVFCMY